MGLEFLCVCSSCCDKSKEIDSNERFSNEEEKCRLFGRLFDKNQNEDKEKQMMEDEMTRECHLKSKNNNNKKKRATCGVVNKDTCDKFVATSLSCNYESERVPESRKWKRRKIEEEEEEEEEEENKLMEQIVIKNQQQQQQLRPKLQRIQNKKRIEFECFVIIMFITVLVHLFPAQRNQPDTETTCDITATSLEVGEDDASARSTMEKTRRKLEKNCEPLPRQDSSMIRFASALEVARPDMKPFQDNHICQSYRKKPEGTITVTEGESFEISCEIDNQEGDTVWAIRGLPAFQQNRTRSNYRKDIDRVEIFGEAKLGVHNLRIKNAHIKDAGKYECQIGKPPNSPHGHPFLKASVDVIVLPRPTMSMTKSDNDNDGQQSLNRLDQFSNIPINEAKSSHQTRDNLGLRLPPHDSSQSQVNLPSAFVFPHASSVTNSQQGGLSQITNYLSSIYSNNQSSQSANSIGIVSSNNNNNHYGRSASGPLASAIVLGWPYALVLIAVILMMANVFLCFSLAKRHRRNKKLRKHNHDRNQQHSQPPLPQQQQQNQPPAPPVPAIKPPHQQSHHQQQQQHTDLEDQDMIRHLHLLKQHHNIQNISNGYCYPTSINSTLPTISNVVINDNGCFESGSSQSCGCASSASLV